MQESTAPTSANTAHPEGQVVGNRIYYGGGLNGHCTCCASPIWDRRMRVFVGLTFFFFFLSMLNFIFGITITGGIFFIFFLVLLVCLILYYLRMSRAIARASTMQTVTYSQVPPVATIHQVSGHSQAQAYPAGHPYPPHPYPNQPYPNQPYPSAQPHPSPNQPYPNQPYPSAQPHPSQSHTPQQYPTQPYPYPPQQYPQQTYPAQPYPSTAYPSNQAVSGEKQPIPQGGVPAAPPQPGGPRAQAVPGSEGMQPPPPSGGSSAISGELPPPPSYSDVMSGSNN